MAKETITITLRQPFWGAYAKYGWESRVEGFGIAEEKVNQALDQDKRLVVSFKYGKYSISPKKAVETAEKYQSYFFARDNTKLLIIPRTAFRRIMRGQII